MLIMRTERYRKDIRERIDHRGRQVAKFATQPTDLLIIEEEDVHFVDLEKMRKMSHDFNVGWAKATGNVYDGNEIKDATEIPFMWEIIDVVMTLLDSQSKFTDKEMEIALLKATGKRAARHSWFRSYIEPTRVHFKKQVGEGSNIQTRRSNLEEYIKAFVDCPKK